MYSLYVLRTGRRSATERLDRLEGQVWLEPVPSAFATEAGLLVAAERRSGVEAVVRVRPDDARAQAARHREDPRPLLRPHARTETVRRVVRLLHRLVRCAEGQHGEHRPEDLLLRDAVALRHVREDGRDEVVALLRKAARGLVDLGAFLLAGRDQLADLVQLHLRVDRADVRVLVERRAHAEGAEAALELADCV